MRKLILILGALLLPLTTSADRWSGEEYAASHSVQQQWAGQLLNAYAFSGDEHILDIGCGDGSLTAEMAACAGLTLGVDLSPNMITHAQEAHASLPNLHFEVGNAAALDFAPEFDLVTCFTCLHWVLDQEAALEGIYNSLKPGGDLLITIPMEGALTDAIAATRDSDRWCDYFSDYVLEGRLYTPAEYGPMLAAAGFVDLDVRAHVTITWMENPTAVRNWMARWLPEQYRLPEELRESFCQEIIDRYITHQPRRGQEVGVALDVLAASAKRPPADLWFE